MEQKNKTTKHTSFAITHIYIYILTLPPPRHHTTMTNRMKQYVKQKIQYNTNQYIRQINHNYKEKNQPFSFNILSFSTTTIDEIEQKKTAMRTHTCGELTDASAGESVTLVGWVQSLRSAKGGMAFATLRDAYGETQIIKPASVMINNNNDNDDNNELPLESVVCIKGTVQARPTNQVKKDKSTGTIEVVADNIEIYNKADWENVPLVQKQHFNPKSPLASEALRLKYRHLDLRRPVMQRNLRLRAAVTSAARNSLETLGFVDVETPLLFKSTPEGAREFLVPTRTPERFWALPQSPQQYKQLLMVAGLDRYYQIARCFRDESGRADRQPEFTQLDIEMSFIDSNDIMLVVESVVENMINASKEILITHRNNNNTVKQNDNNNTNTDKFEISKITYEEAGCDKPNLPGYTWVTEFPLFELNEETGMVESTHHPFTSPHPDDEHILWEAINNKDPMKALDVRGLHYDLVTQGVEVGGGSIRIHDSKLQLGVFEDILRLSPNQVGSFHHLLDALDHGCPPHGGIALGLDRFISLLCGDEVESIRDVIAFPKSTAGEEVMTGAPGMVTKEQLDEYHIVTKV